MSYKVKDRKATLKKLKSQMELQYVSIEVNLRLFRRDILKAKSPDIQRAVNDLEHQLTGMEGVIKMIDEEIDEISKA